MMTLAYDLSLIGCRTNTLTNTTYWLTTNFQIASPEPLPCSRFIHIKRCHDLQRHQQQSPLVPALPVYPCPQLPKPLTSNNMPPIANTTIMDPPVHESTILSFQTLYVIPKRTKTAYYTKSLFWNIPIVFTTIGKKLFNYHLQVYTSIIFDWMQFYGSPFK